MDRHWPPALSKDSTADTYTKLLGFDKQEESTPPATKRCRDSNNTDDDSTKHRTIRRKIDQRTLRWQTILQRKNCSYTPPATTQLPSFKQYAQIFESWQKEKEEDEEVLDDQMVGILSLDEWKRYVVDAVTVHLYPDATKEWDTTLVMLPIAWSIAASNADLNLLIGRIAGRAIEIWDQSPRAAEIKKNGDIIRGVSHHKKEILTIGELRYVLEACASHRPAFEVIYKRGEKIAFPVLHFYAAMGLQRQHPFQQACLARTRDNLLAGCIVRATNELLDTGPALVSTQGRACEVELLDKWKQAVHGYEVPWATKETFNVLTTLTQLHTETKKVDTCIAATTLAECAPIVRLLIKPNDAKMFTMFKQIYNKCPTHTKPQKEPWVRYHYATPNWRTPPTVIANRHKQWRGELLVGGLDHRLCRSWMEWRGVTHVVNCTGRFREKASEASKREETPTWAMIHDPRYNFNNVMFLDWCIRSHNDRERYEETFARVHTALSQKLSVVYVHCKNGEYQSCQMIYALLRIIYGLNNHAATEALRNRRAIDGTPVTDSTLDKDTQTWLETILNKKEMIWLPPSC